MGVVPGLQEWYHQTVWNLSHHGNLSVEWLDRLSRREAREMSARLDEQLEADEKAAKGTK